MPGRAAVRVLGVDVRLAQFVEVRRVKWQVLVLAGIVSVFADVLCERVRGIEDRCPGLVQGSPLVGDGVAARGVAGNLWAFLLRRGVAAWQVQGGGSLFRNRRLLKAGRLVR